MGIRHRDKDKNDNRYVVHKIGFFARNVRPDSNAIIFIHRESA